MRRSIKRAHNALDLIIPELEAWRSRILALEGKERADFIAIDEAADAEALALMEAGEFDVDELGIDPEEEADYE